MKIYTIYAILAGKTIFIGKTTSSRVSAVYHRHRRGEVCATQAFSALGIKPKLHVLTRKEMEEYEAFRWVVAYIYIFQGTGFEILNSAKTIQKANNLYNETQRLVKDIKEESIEDLLSRTVVNRPRDADFAVQEEELAQLKPADQRITLRVSTYEKERFMQLANDFHLSQRQTLQYLISKKMMPQDMFPPWEDDIYVRTVMKAVREENEKLRRENQKLRAYREGEKPYLENLRVALSTYFEKMQSLNPVPIRIERGKYRGYPDVHAYLYPIHAGIFLVRPTAILTGKGPYAPQFVLVKANDGECYKFRFYPKRTFCGVKPNNSRFALRGSSWLMGCAQASDGAMDLTFALPLDIRRGSS